jgi:4-hydroxy-tetrahydrodipicolinate synthase
MTRDEVNRLMQGPMATVVTPFDDDYEVDHVRMAEAVRYYVDGGLVKGKAVLKVAAAMGEGPMLRDDEWPALLRTAVQAAEDRATIMCGIHYKDTKRTIEDCKRASDLGAIGVQINPPIFNDPSQDDLLRYFGDISDAIDIGILLYNTPWLRGGNVLPETILKMKDFEQLAGIKWSVPDDQNYEDMSKFSDIFNVIDNTQQPARCRKLGGRGYINLTSEIYPPHDLRVWELIEGGRYEEGQALFDKVNDALRDLYAKQSEVSGGQARLKKGMMAIMGMPMGASRPPSLPLSGADMAEVREVMISFGWPVRN